MPARPDRAQQRREGRRADAAGDDGDARRRRQVRRARTRCRAGPSSRTVESSGISSSAAVPGPIVLTRNSTLARLRVARRRPSTRAAGTAAPGRARRPSRTGPARSRCARSGAVEGDGKEAGREDLAPRERRSVVGLHRARILCEPRSLRPSASSGLGDDEGIGPARRAFSKHFSQTQAPLDRLRRPAARRRRSRGSGAAPGAGRERRRPCRPEFPV